MINYIRSEIYRVMHRRSLYTYYLIMTTILVGTQISSAVNYYGEPIAIVLQRTAYIWLVSYPVFFGIQIYLAVYNDDKNNGVIANVLTSGVSKINYVIGKLIVQLICIIVSLAYLTLVYIIMYAIILGGIPTIDFTYFSGYLLHVFVLCLAMTAYSSVIGILHQITKKGSLSILAFILLATQIIDSLFEMVVSGFNLPIFKFIQEYSINTAFVRAISGYTKIDFKYVAILVAYIIIGVVVTLYILKKKDVVAD